MAFADGKRRAVSGRPFQGMEKALLQSEIHACCENGG
jgi:hypothetical protein